METANQFYQFDITKVIAESHAYINAIDDYQIEVQGKRVVNEDKIIQYGSREYIKVLLVDFLFTCKQEATKGESHLLQFLRSRRHDFQATQAQTIGKLNDIIDRKSGEEKARFEKMHKQFLDFFHHNYALIDLITARITGLPLNESLQYKLKRAGVAWIIDGSQPTSDREAIEASSSKVSEDNNDLKKIATRPAVALMLFYLEKIRYFEAGSSIRTQIREIEAQRYGFTPDGLYNEYLTYKEDIKRIKPSNIPHIEKAIQLLNQQEWQTAILYATADLSNCKSLLSEQTT